MKRIFSMLCVLALMLGMIAMPAYATDAEGAVQQNRMVLSANAENLTVETDTYIDLNGYNIAGVTVKDGATLYVSDSQTDDYTVADGIYGKITDAEGNVQAAEGYVAINGDGLSYHKADLTLTSMTLRPAVAGVYYNSAFAADEVVAANVECYGVALSVIAEPTAENLDTLCGYSTIYGFEAGEKSGTLLSGIMTEGNTDFANNRNAAMNIYGRAYIKTTEGYTFGATASRNLKEQVEAIDAIFSQLNEAQSTAIVSLYSSYESVMENWNVPNIKHAAPKGDTVITVPVETEDGEVTETVTVEQDGVSITIPFGTLVESNELTLTVTRLDASESEIEAGEGQTLMPFDVHVDGISAENTQPLTVALGKVMPENLNMGNYTVYHVEETGTSEMELVASAEDLTDHNQYAYTLDGELTLNMATFSVVAVVAEEPKWEGNVDHSWYLNTIENNAQATYFEIRNADQLWSLSQIVGGMAEGIEQDSFTGKTIKLLADINLADGEENNVANKIFYPIGYWNNEGTYERLPVEERETAVSSGFYAFEGIFDGNGNTISNIYQNTWEMKGDHNWYDTIKEQYFRDGMGLFGKVYGGTVKNLTVRNFKSDGEITTTGVIAAYADCGATFENIAIFDCNPRVYNIGNGGIVGCVGWYAKAANLKTTFKNITVDNSNKISALWGSYDVPCGGIVGQYYPTSGQTSANKPANGGISFENCHVSAIMDVNNDVCANYQYYAYRYAGMLIGSVAENVTLDGHVYPKMDGITAEDCTVHFGDWNDYYYCEIIDNTTASYTHDYQMSRLEQVKSVEGTTITPLKGEAFTVPATGRVNYVVVNGNHATENATCYHFKDGAVWTHDMGGIQTGIDENGDGQDDLKEDKQHIYLEFNNLVTGNGWGVTTKGVGDLDGVTILDREVPNSVEKFAKADTAKDTYTAESKVTIGELFEAIENAEVDIVTNNIWVAVSPAAEGSTAGGTYTADTTDWTKGTLTFTGTGVATITITDYYFCTPTTIAVTIEDQQPVVKFETLFTGDFLYRVGNQNAFAIGKIFADAGVAEIGTVDVTVMPVTSGVSGTYTSNATWTNGTLKFTGTGVVKVTITDNDYCTPTTLYLEVVDAQNVTGATSATDGNKVLLNDCGLSSMTVSGRYTFYGNGFTMTYTGNGQYLNNGLKQGVVTVSGNGTLDNVRIKASIYPRAYMYYGSTLKGDYVQGGPSSVEGDKTRYHYQLSAVAASEHATISNCYIYGGRTNIFVNTGDVTIKDTVLECGVVANVQIQSTSDHAVTLEDVTTIQHQVNPTIGTDEEKEMLMLGSGVIVGPDTATNPTIVLNGYLKQYNWVTQEDKNAVDDEVAKMLIEGALNETAYNHTINGNTASNLGIIYMNAYDAPITNNTGLPYKLAELSMSGASGQVYSLKGATAEQIYSDYENADRTTVNGLYTPQFKYSADLGGQIVPDEGGDEFCYREGDSIKVLFPSGDTKELDLAALVNIQKYTGQDLSLVITCKDSSGNVVAVNNGNVVAVNNGKVALSAAGDYTVTYTVTDTLFFDKDGNAVKHSVTYSWNVKIEVSLKDTAVPDAYYVFDSSKQKMGYYKPSIGDVKHYLPFLAGLKIYDYIGSEAYLRFDGDKDFNKIASITITGYASNEAYIEVKLTDGGVINTKFLARADSGGASTYTGSIKTSNNTIYFVNGGGTSNKDSTTTAAYWYVDYYKFTGFNGVEITSAQQTFTSPGSSASTPSGNFSTTIKYTVTYDANGGNCGQTVGYATSASTAVALATPTRSGYIFAGWYTAASGGTRVGGAGDSYTPSSNITLYAQWGKPCTVTYNANGGSCGTASEKYTGTALTLPTPTRDGYWFVGWYDAAEGGNKIGDAGAKYNPANEITLYAHWQEKVEYTVTYNANGGSCNSASATYQGTALTLPTPTRTGYKFLGWYTAASGGNKIGDAGVSYVPSSNITLYAQWTINEYKITLTTSNASVSGVTNGQKIVYGTTVSVTVKFDKNNSKTFTVKNDTTGETILSQNAAGTYTFTMPASNVTINASSSGCFAEGTLITLADGTKKPVEQITYEDELLAWDLNTGKYVTTVPSLIEIHEREEVPVINLQFADGTVVRIVTDHGFYDVEENNFVFIDAENIDSYIGHEFVQVGENGTYHSVELVGYEITVENVAYYTIQTAFYNNCIAENMFTLTSPPEGVDGWFDYFEIGEGMKYDEEKMQVDIEKYGLYTYEDFAEYVTYEQFLAFNGPYLKVLVGRGVLTYEDILELIEIFVP